MTGLLKKIFLANNWNLTGKMKKIFVVFLLGMLMFSCEDKAKDEVKHVQKVVYYYAETDIPWVAYIYDVVGNDSTWVEEVWFHENGELQLIGPIVDNKREGEFRGYYPSGKLMSVGEFKHGKREGKGTIYYENGNVNIINYYCRGKACGMWGYYNEDGELVDVKEY